MKNRGCRYIIGNYGNGIECFVTFDKDDKEVCRIDIDGKIFLIAVKLLELIAKPAP